MSARFIPSGYANLVGISVQDSPYMPFILFVAVVLASK